VQLERLVRAIRMRLAQHGVPDAFSAAASSACL